MAKDRALDRHLARGFLYRPVPPELLERVDDVVGPRRRSQVISALLARFLDGGAMPTPAELSSELDISGSITEGDRP